MARRLQPTSAGVVFVIGGAEDKRGRSTVLRRFVELCGGRQARIALVPTASSRGQDVVDDYDVLFRRLGAAEVVALRPETRVAAEDPALAARLDDATGVFMTGGNQLKLSAVIGGTAFAAAIHAAHLRGAAVGGTSAGASFVTEHMVAFGTDGTTPKQRMSTLAAGLGLLPGVIVDQHFAQRNRYGRLLSLVAHSPSLLGIGLDLDEDTAAEVHGGHTLEVVGKGAVFVIDGSAAVTNAHEARRSAPLLVSGAVVHTLPAGSRFDLITRRLIDHEEVSRGTARRLVAEDD
jgi:cyanophycinase